MCTALSLKTRDRYFGRTLDIDRSYGEEVCVLPRRFPLVFRKKETLNEHYAIIGMATVVGDMPLLYDGTNEHGLSMAGLNFPGNACYYSLREDKDNITPFEFIPWILGQCKTVDDAINLLEKINLCNIPFSEKLPLSPLHWMISDGELDIVVETVKDGMHIHHNPTGVMTNNPPFDHHMLNLNNYRNLRADNGQAVFADNVPLATYCQGLGAIGLPGDVSSMSRFVRAAFLRANSVCEQDEDSSVGQFFHVLSAVEMNRGACKTDGGEWDITVYTSCVNADKGIYYYTTYGNRQISCVDMHKTDLNGSIFYRFPLVAHQQINKQN